MRTASKENIDFVDEKERELFATAILGEETRQFLLTHPVGKLLHHRAKIQYQQAEVDALKVDPDGWRGWFHARRQLRVIRNRAEVARLFIAWVGEAMVEGSNAELELNDYRK